MWMLSHREELKNLPRRDSFLYENVDVSFSVFRQATSRGLLKEVAETAEGKKVWRVDEDKLEELDHIKSDTR
jgi:uncharacterized phage-like protein YoqJ